MNLDIVYEDDDVIVVNKANGVVVHPAVGSPNHTLVNGLMFHSHNLSDVNGEFRPGIVHRIDAYTTGLLMVAKNNEAHNFLAKQLEEKKTTRVYVALVHGVINNDTGTIDAPIGRDKSDRKKMAVTDINGKDAVTHFKVLKRFKNATLIELKLETGRTHQIRVHMNYIGHPVVNDPVYGNRKLIDDSGQCLHAKVLGFIHPKTHKYMEFDSELPECFTNILELYEKE
jgi:23S rRNA pseudouridine1911/1915/1917 synthase